MSSYMIVYSCGHKGRVRLTGPQRTHDWECERLQNRVCLDCYKEQRQQVVQAETETRELIPLVGGSPAQMSWALSIRLRVLNEVEQMPQTEDHLIMIAMDKLYDMDDTLQWITWRDWSGDWILADLKKKLLATPTSAQQKRQHEDELEQRRIAAIARAEAILRPDQPQTETIAEITYTENSVRVCFDENREDFNTLVRHLGYAWNRERRYWERTLKVRYTGPARERAIELGQVLLSHQFCVCVFDPDVRVAIEHGVFEPEQTRWISLMLTGKYIGHFAIEWGRHEDYYDVAQRIPGSRYVKPYVLISPEYFEMLLDFAERYAFRLTQHAREAVEQARQVRNSMHHVSSREAITLSTQKHAASTRPPVLDVPSDVRVELELLDADYD